MCRTPHSNTHAEALLQTDVYTYGGADMDPNAKPADEYVYTDFYTSVHPNYPVHGDIESHHHEFRVTYGSDNYASAITHIYDDGSEHPTSGDYDTVTYTCDDCGVSFKFFGSNLFLR